MFNMAPAFTTCLFFSCFFLERWSLVSLQGAYPKPSVKLSPGSLVARGGSLTINCTSEYPHMSFFLYKGIDIYLREDPPGSEAVFAINGVRETDEGDYHCRYHPRSGGGVWSDASDPFQIRVLDLSKPSISYKPLWSREGDYKITCSALQDKAVKRFFLYQNGGKAAKTDRSPSPQSQSVTFPISDVNARAGTEYRCSYQIQESGESVESPLSDPIQIGKENEQETSTATTPRNDGQTPSVEPTESSGMDDTLIIAVVCAVLLVVILVVAFILYIKCKPKKANGDIQKRNLPLNEEKKTDSLEPMYAIVTKVKTSNNTITPEVKKQEEGGYDEGLTYAVINKDALKNKKKNSAPPFQEPEPTLYASVNIH